VTLPFLDGEALARANVCAAEAMAVIETAIKGAAQQPFPPALRRDDGGFFQPLIAALPDEDVACVNWLSFHPGNAALGRPHSGGLLILNKFSTGEPLCSMDGIWVSHRRTGFVAGLAVKYLAGSFTDAALIGAGAIAPFAIEALLSLGPFAGELRVCTRTPASAERFCAGMVSRHGIRARPVADSREAVRGARLVITSTTHAGAPFLERDWLAGGALVVMIDRLRVVTADLLTRAERIVTTSRESLASRGFAAPERVETLPEIIAAGACQPVTADAVTLCDAGGIAVADLALAALLWRRLQDRI
jgi:ornithine cyclodeaminase/alanine dehydrogenase-like protein (mu-crystallin family)